MILWRLCRLAHANLSGEGGRLYSGRWHSAGRPIIYTATEPSLAVLEVRVNLDVPFELLPDDYVLVSIETGPADLETLATLPENPRAHGDAWLQEQRTLLLAVPSVIIPQARNVLINPAHPAAAPARIVRAEPFNFDPRLWGVFR